MKRVVLTVTVLAAFAAGVVITRTLGHAEEKKADEFARQTIDIGMVVGDIEKSAKFYTDVIGFKEAKGFSVSGDYAAEVGLTDKKPLNIRVFVLGDSDTATKLKLMEVKDASPKKGDSHFIHSQLGVRYLTIFVTDTNAALARLKKADVMPLAKGPAKIPESIIKDPTFLTVVRDPDGNFVELVGPKK